MQPLIARPDPALRAIVTRSTPLLYTDGADEEIDRPAHVRAGSGAAWVGGVLAVVQDDTNFLALVDVDSGAVRSVPLPAGEGGVRQFGPERGNKQWKMDLEACVVVPEDDGELLIAFGSGSTGLREKILLARGIPHDPRIEVIDAPDFYAGLRNAAGFAGSELNVEGAAWMDGHILLLNRGNGAPIDGRQPVDATCEIDWPGLRAHLRDASSPPPAPRSIVPWALGDIDGYRLTFTDAASIDGVLMYTATAEQSPNTYDDGPVAGSVLGVMDGSGAARWAVLETASGGRFDGKVEGIAAGRRPGTVLVVIDRDDPHLPCELCEVRMDGPW